MGATAAAKIAKQPRRQHQYDLDLIEEMRALNDAITADQLPFNPQWMYAVASQPTTRTLQGIAFTLMLSMASLTENPIEGCTATQAQILRRARTLNDMLALIKRVGVKRITHILMH